MDEDGFRLKDARVAIVGLGLMGASLALDLRGRCAELVGVSRSPDTLAFALEQHIVDRCVEFEAALDCDLLILAAPVRTIVRQLEQMVDLPGGSDGGRRTVVLDLGSTKAEIVRAMEKLPEHFDPVGGHPMCGKEVAGIRAAEAGLYRGKTFVLTPLERSSAAALALVRELIACLGSRELLLPANVQDQLVALTSHVPHLAAAALVRAAQTCPDERLKQVAASGFRDTTRLAASDLNMMVDILLTNRPAVLAGLASLRRELDRLSALIQEEDETGLREALAAAQAGRRDLLQASE
jgi:prephenate dehydrogenase